MGMLTPMASSREWNMLPMVWDSVLLTPGCPWLPSMTELPPPSTPSHWLPPPSTLSPSSTTPQSSSPTTATTDSATTDLATTDLATRDSATVPTLATLVSTKQKYQNLTEL